MNRLADSFAGSMTAPRLTPAPRGLWEVAQAADPAALVSQSPQWIDAMEATGRYVDASRLYEGAGGEPVILPLVRRVGPARYMNGVGSFPQSWGVGGVVGKAVSPDIISAVMDDLAQGGFLRVHIRPNPLQVSAWAAAMPASAIAIARRAHVLELGGSTGQLWGNRFTGACRRSIRKAERSGLDVEGDSTGRLAPVFHELFIRSVDRWAGQQHEPEALAQWRARRRDPLAKWQAIAAALRGACRFWIARKDGRPVAGLIVLQGTNAQYTRGAMDKELAGPLRANHLLMWLAIQDAVGAGCHHFHFGESGSSAGLARYKEQFGAIPYDHCEYRLERLPITRLDTAARQTVKRLLRFRDT
jgi:hypothetical protein